MPVRRTELEEPLEKIAWRDEGFLKLHTYAEHNHRLSNSAPDLAPSSNFPTVRMNGVNGVPGPPGLWSEARNADGRVYYYNTQTKATQWTKPLELMSPAEVSAQWKTKSRFGTNGIQRALANQPWKEYTAEGGRKYWYNTETKQSSWEMPEVYKTALAQSTPASKPAAPYALPPPN